MGNHTSATAVSYRVGAGAIAALLLIARPGAAAPQTPASPVITAPAAAPLPKNLYEALPSLRWDPVERGPLIIVVPQAATPTKPLGQAGSSAPMTPPVLVSGVYRTPDLLDYFGRRMVRLRGVTVFAPAQMVVLNTNPGKPDIFYKMSFQDKLQVLEATLTPAQWRLITSPGGLGMGDLEGDQRDLFNSLLPNPFVYQAAMVVSGPEAGGEVPVKREPPVKNSISSTQRAGIRLRIHRETTLFSPSTDPSSPFSVGYVSKEAPGTTVLSVEERFDRDRRMSYGVKLSETVASYLKTGQIDFDAAALNVPVSFADAATVGDLIQRIRVATRIEIYADLRLARLPLSIRAAPDAKLRAGELLKALCWGVTGAVRYVRADQGGSDSDVTNPGVFILTDEVEGLGARWGRITDWSMGASRAEYAAKRRRDRIIRGQKVLETIGFAADEPFKPTAEQATVIEKGWPNGVTRALGVSFPISVLPPDLQERAVQSARDTNAVRAKDTSSRARKPVSEEMVSVSVRLGVRLDVPGVGSIPMGLYSYGGLDSFLPEPDYSIPLVTEQPPAATISLAPALKAGGVLSITAANEEDARIAVRAARARGLRQLWISLPPDRDDVSAKDGAAEFQRTLAAAVAEAQQPAEKVIEVLAVARILSVPPRKVESKPTAPPDLSPVDLTLNGQPGGLAVQSRLNLGRLVGEDTRAYEKEYNQARDWLLPDAPAVIPQAVTRLSSLAGTPGLAGIVLTDVLAPGYRTPKGDASYFNANYNAFGYTPRRRIAAIRAFGCDPIDIVLNRGYITADAPGPFLIEGTAQRIAVEWSRQQKAVQNKEARDPAEADDLAMIADASPLSAWNALRFRSANTLLDSLYSRLAEVKKQRKEPFAVYLENFDGGVSGWFGTWDDRNKLPVALAFQPDENYSSRTERSARAASGTVLYRQSYYPPEETSEPVSNTDTPPVVPADKFARDFNRALSRSKNTWDGYVFDLRDMPLSKALEIVESVTPAGPPVRISPSRPRGTPLRR